MLQSSRLLLRALEPGDLNATYLSWLNHPAVNCHLETRFLPQTIKALQVYWRAHRDDPSIPWFVICLAIEGRHIGTIKLGPIQWLHRRADLSLFIGECWCWGQGYASEGSALMHDLASRELDLQKLIPVIYAGNFGSPRAFEKCRFELESSLFHEVVIAWQRLDVWHLGFPRSQWSPSS